MKNNLPAKTVVEPHEPENVVQPIPSVLSENKLKRPVIKGFKVEHNKYLSGHVTDFPMVVSSKGKGFFGKLNSDTLEVESSAFESM